MFIHPPVQVEINVQDFTDPESDPPEISVATWENWFYRWLDDLRPDLSLLNSYELSLRLTTDQDIHALNTQYRQKDQPTDVLAFAALEVSAPYLAAMEQQPVYLGDIVISVETAQMQAQQQGHSLRQELAWLATHGLLHLLGWDHPNDARLAEMLMKQEALLQTVGLETGYDWTEQFA